jgi:hypothetical protein
MWENLINYQSDQMSHNIVTNDNTYMINQRMKPYFIDFFSIQKGIVAIIVI